MPFHIAVALAVATALMLVGFALLATVLYREQMALEEDLLELFELQERISNARFQSSVRKSLNLLERKSHRSADPHFG